MSDIRAGIVNASKFTFSGSKIYGSYLDYIDRNEAVRSTHFHKFNALQFDGYNHYMENPEKSTGLFTATNSNLTKEQVANLKQQFVVAQQNDSIMWQDVLSFDNRFLEKHGIYDSKTGQLDEAALQEGTRSAVQAFLKNEGLEHTAIWCASIHLNTDNIHVHIATVEPQPTREYKEFISKKTGETYQARRGYRKQGTLDVMKEKMVSSLIDRTEERNRITALIRTDMLPQHNSFARLKKSDLHHQFQSIQEALPADRRTWKYNMNAMQQVRPMLDKFITNYLNTFQQKKMAEFNELLKNEVQELKEIYGEGTKQANRADEYATNKMNELYARLGNVVLREMQQQAISQQNSYKGNRKYNSYGGNSVSRPGRPVSFRQMASVFKKLERAFDRSFQSQKNQAKHRQLMQEQEKEKEHGR